MTRQRLIVWGAGGHGRVVAETALAAGYEVVGFVDRDPMKTDVLITEESFRDSLQRDDPLIGEAEYVVLGIGNNEVRRTYAMLLGPRCAPALIHPRATVSPSAVCEPGTVIFAGAVVNSQARLGPAVIVNSGAVVEHDCQLEAGVHVSPGAVLTGGVTVGACSWIGAGATLIPNVQVGAHTIVGAGAVVLRDVPDAVTVVGNPARIIKS